MLKAQLGLSLRNIWQAFNKDAYALPLDIFRIAQGLITFFYFLHLFYQAEDFSNPNGLIDHVLVQEIFWFTRISLFHPGLPLLFFQITFILGCIGSLALSAGFYPRVIAFLLFTIAVSTYRWNFPVTFWDDGVMHLMLFWLILLPVGRTLTYSDCRKNGHRSIDIWNTMKVPGATMRCFLWNIALIYFVSGVWKLTSEMWLDGVGLYVALKTPMSYFPDIWSYDLEPVLKVGNYATMLLEICFPIFLVLPKHHPIKWFMLLLLLIFHLGIISLIRVPFSNLSLVAAIVLLFRHEIMALVLRETEPESRLCESHKPTVSVKISLLFVVILTLSMTRYVPGFSVTEASQYDIEESGIDARSVGGITPFHKSLYSILWVMGLAQRYQLFDWIDQRNFTVSYDIYALEESGEKRDIDSKTIFPLSARSIILQAYMHDIVWVDIPEAQKNRLKLTLYNRYARRYCENQDFEGQVIVQSNLQRIDPRQQPIFKIRNEKIMEFHCTKRRHSIDKFVFPSWKFS